MDSSDYRRKFVFEWIGAFSVLSLLMMAYFFAPGLLRGDLTNIKRFFEQYPGSEPFVIFVLPIVVISGSAWIYRKISKRQPNQDQP